MGAQERHMAQTVAEVLVGVLERTYAGDLDAEAGCFDYDDPGVTTAETAVREGLPVGEFALERV
jgi:hypothetical protein